MNQRLAMFAGLSFSTNVVLAGLLILSQVGA